MVKVLNVTLAVRIDTNRDDLDKIMDDLSFNVVPDTSFNNGDTKVEDCEVVDYFDVE